MSRYEVMQSGFCDPVFEVHDVQDSPDLRLIATFKHEKHANMFAAILNALDESESE
jgi:hypothetical protein